VERDQEKKEKKKRRGRKEGSIYHRADGLWVAEIDLGVVDGKRTRKQLYAKTRKEVTDKLKECLVAQHQGIPLSFDREKVSAFLGRWVKSAATPRLRPRILVGYSRSSRCT
jgi:integrase